MRSKPLNLEQHTFYSPKLQSVVKDAIDFFARTPVCKLPPPKQFIGSGVYAIYYTGVFEYYKKIAEKNDTCPGLPIYVGKAVPPGWRTARVKESHTPDLYRRLCEHCKSIKQVSNLKPKDFCCRFMILSRIEGDLVVPVEAELIRKYKPLWNTVVDGFGNHDPGSGRYNQAKSEWDILHHGRGWAKKLTGKSARLDDVLAKIVKYEHGLSRS